MINLQRKGAVRLDGLGKFLGMVDGKKWAFTVRGPMKINGMIHDFV
jgi:hypothetical protein